MFVSRQKRQPRLSRTEARTRWRGRASCRIPSVAFAREAVLLQGSSVTGRSLFHAPGEVPPARAAFSLPCAASP